MAWTLRAAAAAGKAIRRGMPSSSSGAQAQATRRHFHGDHSSSSRRRYFLVNSKHNSQADMALDKIKETDISSLTVDTVVTTMDIATKAHRDIMWINIFRTFKIVGTIAAGFISGRLTVTPSAAKKETEGVGETEKA